MIYFFQHCRHSCSFYALKICAMNANAHVRNVYALWFFFQLCKPLCNLIESSFTSGSGFPVKVLTFLRRRGGGGVHPLEGGSISLSKVISRLRSDTFRE